VVETGLHPLNYIERDGEAKRAAARMVVVGFLFFSLSGAARCKDANSDVRWVDADIVLMNPQIPLDVFIPPSPEFDDVNMLVTHDRHGLNNGCFLIRVSPWAIKLLSGVIAYHNFRPEVELKYTEQSALEAMINDVSQPLLSPSVLVPLPSPYRELSIPSSH
jgi:hypothetical protein